MVFDGSGPLVKRCDGFDGSLWSNDEYGEKFQNRAFLFHSELTLFFKAASTTGRLLMTAATTGAPTPRRGTRLKLSASRKTATWPPLPRKQSTNMCGKE